jgi:hypothetical protein
VPALVGVVVVRVRVVEHVRGHAEVTEEDGAVVVDEQVRGFDVTVNEPVDMEIADDQNMRISDVRTSGEIAHALEPLERLLEDALDDLLVHPARRSA